MPCGLSRSNLARRKLRHNTCKVVSGCEDTACMAWRCHVRLSGGRDHAVVSCIVGSPFVRHRVHSVAKWSRMSVCLRRMYFAARKTFCWNYLRFFDWLGTVRAGQWVLKVARQEWMAAYHITECLVGDLVRHFRHCQPRLRTSVVLLFSMAQIIIWDPVSSDTEVSTRLGAGMLHLRSNRQNPFESTEKPPSLVVFDNVSRAHVRHWEIMSE